MTTILTLLAAVWLALSVLGVRRGQWSYAVDAAHVGVGGALVLVASWLSGDATTALVCALGVGTAASLLVVDAACTSQEVPDVRLSVDGDRVALLNAGTVPASEVVMELAVGGFEEVGTGQVCSSGHWHVGDLAPAAAATAVLAASPGQIEVSAHGPGPRRRRWAVPVALAATVAATAAWTVAVAYLA